MKAGDCAPGTSGYGRSTDIVADVFHMLLQPKLRRGGDDAAAGIDISAMVLLSGSIKAQCLVEFPQATAKKVDDAFLGCENNWENALIEDAVGELCNMIAGGWKSKLGALASAPTSRCRQSRDRAAGPQHAEWVPPENAQDLRIRQLAIHRNSGHPPPNR